MRRALREVGLATRRSPLLALLGVVTIACSLLALGLHALVLLNVREALRNVEARVEVRGFLVDDTPASAVDSLLATVRQLPQVASAGHVSADSALRRARTELVEFRDVLGEVALPASVEVRLRDGLRDPASAKTVADRLAAFAAVDDVRYGAEWVEKLYRLRTATLVGGLVLSALFALIALSTIGTTVRLAVLARAREIEIMRLVGATDAFVRTPYLVDGLCKGLVGGLVALVVTWAAHVAISRTLVDTSFFTWWQAAIGVAAGGVLGLLGSLVSVGRQLRRLRRGV